MTDNTAGNDVRTPPMTLGLPSNTTTPRTVSLVLGSGGARGLAHVGVIRWLQANDFEIRSISGCSIGALVGGVYAAGGLDVFEAWVRTITRSMMLAMMDFSWGGGGLVKGEKFIGTLTAIVGERRIEELPIRYTAVAADIVSGKEVWLQRGGLFEAIRASVSLPLLFVPFESRGMHLIDGGVLNPVPIAPTFGDGTDLTIAVSLSGPPGARNTVPESSSAPQAEALDLVDRIASLLRGSQPVLGDSSRTRRDWSAYDVAYQAFDTMQGAIARQKLAAYPPDYLVEIGRDACRTLEFERAAEMIDLGWQAAQASLGNLAAR